MGLRPISGLSHPEQCCLGSAGLPTLLRGAEISSATFPDAGIPKQSALRCRLPLLAPSSGTWLCDTRLFFRSAARVPTEVPWP
jgi:hypothetical protein